MPHILSGLYVDVEDKEILHGVNLSIGKGETHVLMGPNGTGKSTLGNDKNIPALALSLTGSSVIFLPSNHISPLFTVYLGLVPLKVHSQRSCTYLRSVLRFPY